MSYSALLTTVGLAKIADAIANSTQIEITEMDLGDGAGNPTTPDVSQTALVRSVYRASLNRLEVDPLNANRVIAELIVPYDQGGWVVREVGIYDVDNDLIAVGNFPDVYKPTVVEGGTRELVIRMALVVSNTSALTILADPAVVVATRSWVQNEDSNDLHVPETGSIGQLLKKTGNGRRDYEFADPSDIEITVAARVESQTLAALQTAVVLATLTTEAIAVYIEGVREFGFTVNNATQFTLDASYAAGTKIWVVQNNQLGSLGTVAPTPQMLALRDSAGRTQFVNPAAPQDAATKAYADALGVSAPTVSTIVRRDAAGRTKFVDPAASDDAATKGYADALGTAAATVSTIVRRDAAGRTQFVNPSAAQDAATKAYADALGVSAPTVSTIVRRDAAGRTKFVDPAASDDAATKGYADALGTAAATVSTIVRRDAAGRTQFVNPSAAQDAATKSYVDSSSVRTGCVLYFATSAAPADWFACDGSAISRTAYAALFSLIGTSFGVGNGSTTFNLPDLRGEFIRGWDSARGVDTGRVFGSAQADALQNITGSFRHNGTTDSPVGAFAITNTGNGGDQAGGASFNDGINFDASRVARTAAETRPRNIALLPCIKF